MEGRGVKENEHERDGSKCTTASRREGAGTGVRGPGRGDAARVGVGPAVMGLLLAASFVKGMSGLGFPLIAVPAASLLLSPRDAVVLVALPNLVANLLLVARTRGPEAPPVRLGLVGLTGVPATAAGALLLSALDPAPLSVLLGCATLFFALANLRATPLVSFRRGSARTALLVGTAAGLLQGSTGASGPVLAMYMYGLRLPKGAFIYSLNVLYSVFGAVHVVSLLALGLYRWELGRLAAASLAPLLVGMGLGAWARERVRQRAFNRVVLLLMAAIGANLVLRGLR